MNKLIEKRWSPRAFDSKEIEEDKLEKLFLSASYAASCFNEQPWRFIYAQKSNSELYEKLFSCLVEFNQMWVKTAPMIILTLVKKNFEKTGKENPHAQHDLGLAIGNMSLQALEMDIYVHQMAGFSVDKVKELFPGLGEYDIMTMIAVGYKGNPKELPIDMQKMEGLDRNRKSVGELILKY